MMMKILMLTGASGAGKDFVQSNLNDDVFSISFDKLFGESVHIAFPHYIGPQWEHDIWGANQDQAIDFASAFRTALLRKEKFSHEKVLIQGVQLRKQIWRTAILEAIDVTESDNKHLIAIHPNAEILLEQRVDSAKPYHQTVANLQECENNLAHFKEVYEKEPPDFGNIDKYDSKELALEAANRYFS